MFITYEGPEGSGKTTQRRLLVERLRRMFGENAVVDTREPGGTDVGERCRNILLHGYEDMTPLAEAFLVSASRAALVAKVIQPALTSRKIVVCDRYIDTTYTIQGYGMGVPLEDLRTIVGISSGRLIPNLTIYLDVDPELGYARKRQQQIEQEAAGEFQEFNHMDERAATLARSYRFGYYELISQDPGRWFVVSAKDNATLLPEEIHEQIMLAVLNHPIMLSRFVLD